VVWCCSGRATKKLEGAKKIGHTVPSWWVNLQDVLREVLTKEVTFESEEDPSASTDTPLGPFRSAALVAALQIAAASTLATIFQNQIVSRSTTNAMSSSSVDRGIVFGSLLPVAVKCVGRLVVHVNSNIKASAVKCAAMVFTDILSHTIDRHANAHAGEEPMSEDVSGFSGRVVGAVDALLHVIVKQIQSDSISDIDVFRVAVDAVVAHCSPQMASTVQVSELCYVLIRNGCGAV
jgi:hypothetical protein